MTEFKPGDPEPIVLNQSRVKQYQDCHRLFGWLYIEGLEAVGRRSAPEIGTAVHEGLRVYHIDRVGPAGTHEPKDPGQVDQEALKVAEAVDVAVKKLTARTGPGTAFQDKSLQEAAEIAKRTLEGYFKKYAAEGTLWRPIGQEVQFTVEVGEGARVFLRGRMDNLTVIGGRLFLIDYKTAAKMDPRDLLKYEMDMQLTSYIYGINKELAREAAETGVPALAITAAIIDVLVKTQIPQYAREQYTRTDEELAEFESEFIEIGGEIRQKLRRVREGENWKVVFPKSTNHCFHYGVCAFRDLCLRDTPTRRQMFNRRSPDYVDTAEIELLIEWQKAQEK